MRMRWVVLLALSLLTGCAGFAEEWDKLYPNDPVLTKQRHDKLMAEIRGPDYKPFVPSNPYQAYELDAFTARMEELSTEPTYGY